MDYIFKQKVPYNQALYVERVFRDALRSGKSFNAYQRDMMDKKVSYKRLDMLADWNRGKAIEQAKSWKAHRHAEIWYDNIAMPTMKKKGFTPTKFWEWKRRAENMEFEDEEDLMDWLNYEDEVEETFAELYLERA